MYKTRADALAFAEELAALQLPTGGQPVEAVICAPATALYGLAEALDRVHVGVGAQQMHEAQEGAFTGEVSSAMLLALGCRYVILGHSERRALFAESDAGVARKTAAALERGLIPIVCVGETLEQRENGQTEAVIRNQMGVVLDALGGRGAHSDQVPQAAGGVQQASGVQADGARAGDVQQAGGVQADRLPLTALVFAYEPVWAIGTGRSASAQDAQEVILLIRELIRAALGAAIAQQVRILYGGSVKPDNIGTYLAQPDIDGALVGGASLQPESFAQLWRQSAQ